jgi:predicted O-methyltransferase YrrM
MNFYSKFLKGLAWLRDITDILFLDRFRTAFRRESELASSACRSLRFHTRCKIRPLAWSEIFLKLGTEPPSVVQVIGAGENFENVGSGDYYRVLGTLAKALKPRNIFEFGTYLGFGTYALSLNSPTDCWIHTLDLPDTAAASEIPKLNALDQTHVKNSRFRVGEIFLGKNIERIHQIRADSVTFEAGQYASQMDLVIVDGGHSLPLVTKDTENAFNMLTADGTIIWDDYFHLYPDVVKFLDRLAEEYPLHAIPGTNFVIYSRRWHLQK